MKLLLLCLVLPALASAGGPAPEKKVTQPQEQLSFPHLPAVSSVMNSSTATLGRISNEVSAIHNHVAQLEQANAGKLLERKKKEEQLLKEQVSQNHVLQSQNEQLAMEIAALRKGNDDLRKKAAQLEDGNAALRKELTAVNTKALEASGFIQTTLNLTDDSKAVDLEVLRGKMVKKEHHKHHHHHDAEQEEDTHEVAADVDDDQTTVMVKDVEEVAKKDEAEDSDSSSQADDDDDDASETKKATTTTTATAAQKTEKKDDDDDDKDDANEDDDEDEKAAPAKAVAAVVSTSKLQTSSQKTTSGFLRAIHRGTPTSLVELKASTHHRLRRQRRDEETDEDSSEDVNEDPTNDDDDGQDEEKSVGREEKKATTEDAEADKMMKELRQEIERIHAQDADALANMEADFVKKHKTEDKQMREILAQQKALNVSKASFLETQHQLDVAVSHLEITKGKLEAQMKNLGSFLRNLGHFLLAPSKENPTNLLKQMPALLSKQES